MDFMFVPTEVVWLLALIYQPIVLIYYVINDQARKPYVDTEEARRTGAQRVLRPIVNIFSLSLSGFTVVVLSKILLMNIYGLEVLVYMLGGLLLMTLVTIAYLASFFAALNAKQLVYFAAFVVGAIITYAILVPSGFALEGLYDGEFSEFIVPTCFRAYSPSLPSLFSCSLSIPLKRWEKPRKLFKSFHSPFGIKGEPSRRYLVFIST